MGLDMYLYEHKYISRNLHLAETHEDYATQADLATQIMDLAGLKSEEPWGGITVKATVLYWRKANQIHQWFVTNVQNDVDDCGSYYVEREQLVTLRDTCAEVIRASELVPDMVTNGQTYSDGEWQNVQEPGEVILDHRVAEELLPAQGGFFFGGTDYDQWYLRDVKHTKTGIDKVLENGAGEYPEFEYHSSW